MKSAALAAPIAAPRLATVKAFGGAIRPGVMLCLLVTLAAIGLTSIERDHSPLVLKPGMTMSDSEAACCASAQGLGIALVSMPMAVPFLDSGAVVRVLPDWYVDDGNISIYY